MTPPPSPARRRVNFGTGRPASPQIAPQDGGSARAGSVGAPNSPIAGPWARAMSTAVLNISSRFSERSVSSAVADRVEHLMQVASSDTSVYALHPASPTLLRRTMESVFRYQQLAAPQSTLDQEESNLRHWRAVCADWGPHTPTTRPSIHDLRRAGQDYVDLESVFWAAALDTIVERMLIEWRRNSRGRPYPPKPSSALAVLHGIRRVHIKRLGIEPVSLTLAVQVTEGRLREYADVHGPETLLPRRKEPMPRWAILRMLSLPDGALVGRRTVVRDSLEWVSIRALIAVLAQTGFRKAEVSLGPRIKFGAMHLSMANVVWYIAAADSSHFIAAPTAAQLKLLAPGDYVLLRPPPSKADQLGLHWGADPIYLPFDPTSRINAVEALAELEVARAVSPANRRLVPLFTDAQGAALRQSTLVDLLRDMLTSEHVGMAEEDAKRYTWHSFRIYLACALLAAGAEAQVIQCILRWKTDAALRLYARINAEVYQGWLTQAGGVEVTSVRTTSLPSSSIVGRWLAAAEAADESSVDPTRIPAVDVDEQVARMTRGLDRMWRVANASPDEIIDPEAEDATTIDQ